MMAAAQEGQTSLDLFRLVLSLVRQRTAVPAELQNHFLRVLEEAKSLFKHPENPHGQTSPEAVQLAYQMRLWSELGSALEGITDFRSIRPEVAERLLEKIEPHTVG